MAAEEGHDDGDDDGDRMNKQLATLEPKPSLLCTFCVLFRVVIFLLYLLSLLSSVEMERGLDEDCLPLLFVFRTRNILEYGKKV